MRIIGTGRELWPSGYPGQMVDDRIDASVVPSGSGCAECLTAGGWWLHLRRCAKCGHIGCCDTSPSQHATAHAKATGHSVIRSYEPGEDWFWDYDSNQFYNGPVLAAPEHHPLDQPTPGPAGRVPSNWQRLLH
jgi:Zn-finger in ubiquitin-hydrolases and other protein